MAESRLILPRNPSRDTRGCPRRPRRPYALLVLAASAACVSSEDQADPENAIRIGATLPFSGDRAASGAALERALRLAASVVNATGGLLGRPLELEIRDSHSDDHRGTQATLELLRSDPMPFFIGPEEPRIAYQIAETIKTYRMVNFLPGLTSPTIHDASGRAAWFRLSPSPHYLACALAKQMYRDGIRRANAVTDPDDYSGAFARIFGRVFTDMGGTMVPGLQLPSSGSSFAEIFATIERFSPDATLLVTSPTVGAGVLQEWAVRGKVGRWYLGPTLNNPALLRNVPAGVLEGVLGISPDLGLNAGAFDAYFEAETGIPPLAGAHYYYDAVALLALSIAEGIALSGTIPSQLSFPMHMQRVTAAPGNIVTFDNLALGLALAAAGEDIQYLGAAGSYVLDQDGDSIQNQATIWRVTEGSFQKIGTELCNDEEVFPGY
jgi:ABC-type branched-subunit amino acid transport system substrate-binding protein